ncbi:MAG: GNAT family N-acetyltransferase [Bacteroidales bacterium]|jgi:N-acetylglutamate synthase-like GNAT family acetyltransferase|nr:GNAT family N-acetyltransferase [Bacteroidales bacterium]
MHKEDLFFEKLEKSKYKSFGEKVYSDSFPPCERRLFSLIEPLIREKKEFNFFIIHKNEENNSPIGIISLWEFETFVYIEHFAIEEYERNNGYGKKVIDSLIKNEKKPIILEVEPPKGYIEKRRINFYKQFGFTLLKEQYLQPPYSKNNKPIPMKLMTKSSIELQKNEVFSFVKVIYKEVYNFYDFF